MNGLRFIRTQCNISLSDLAMALGVSRQMVSAWENEKKDLSEKRKNQLSEFFGIEPIYFGEINDEDKEKILGKAMFLWGDGEDEYYLYRCDSEDGKIAGHTMYYETKEREVLLSEEYQEKKRAQKEVVAKIDKQISGPIQNKLRDQMLYINRGVSYYGYCLDNMSAAFSKPAEQKMIYYFRLLEVMKAVSMAFDIECLLDEEKPEYMYELDPHFIKSLSEQIKDHMEPMLMKLNERKSCGKTTEGKMITSDYEKRVEGMTVEEACKLVEKEMIETPLPEEVTTFARFFPK